MVKHFLKILVLSLFILPSSLLISQINLVPNGSFENYSQCPTSVSQADYAIGWTTISQSPDYFNACSTSTCNCSMAGQLCASVPLNCNGFQYAASGSGYVGFYTYNTLTSNYREIINSQLTNTLLIGQKYFVKFKIAFTWGGNSNTATDKIGVRFSTVQHNSVTVLPPINNFSHVYASVPFTDTTNWTTIFKSFVADSNYKFIEVGNFFDDANIVKSVQWTSPSNLSYYYFDDLCVSTDSLYSLNFTTNIKNEMPEDNVIKVYPNPSEGSFLYLNQKLSDAEIYIIDVYGVLVKSLVLKSSNKIDVNLESGIYFIKINTEGKTVLKKIIINNP